MTCLCGCHSQDGAGTRHGFKALGGWRFGNTIDGAQAEYLLVPDAMTNLAPVPEGLIDEQVLMCPDITSTGFSGADRGKIRIGDTIDADSRLTNFQARRYNTGSRSVETWETPVTKYGEFNRLKLPAQGAAIWKLATGTLYYIELVVVSIAYE